MAAFPTASDAADAFLSSSETGSNDESDAVADSDVEDSIGTSQIENPTPSRVTLPTPADFALPIYTPADFSYVNETWLSSPDEMMDTDIE